MMVPLGEQRGPTCAICSKEVVGLRHKVFFQLWCNDCYSKKINEQRDTTKKFQGESIG
jgi:hypothetical protein